MKVIAAILLLAVGLGWAFGQSLPFFASPPTSGSNTAYDGYQEYSVSAALSGLNSSSSGLTNGTAQFSGAYVDHPSFTGVYSTDDMSSYSNGATVSGLNGGTGWAGAYVTVP